MERPKLNDAVEVYPVLTRMAYAYRYQQEKIITYCTVQY